MRPVLLIDFGSTYTKVTAVDLDTETLLGTAASFTTIETDINDGLNNALAILEQQTGPLEFVHRYACSSAAGGLKMIASGLVPELTSEAAKQASLGAGAKIAKIYSFELTEDDVEEIDRIRPDIFLLVGGPTAATPTASSTTPGCSPPARPISPWSSPGTGRRRASASAFWPGARPLSAKTSCPSSGR